MLITRATGQVGSRTIDFLLSNKEIEIVAAVRSPKKAAPFTAQGIATVILDFDDEHTHLPAFEGIEQVLILTGYTVDMLRQSKALLDNAKKRSAARSSPRCLWSRRYDCCPLGADL